MIYLSSYYIDEAKEEEESVKSSTGAEVVAPGTHDKIPDDMYLVLGDNAVDSLEKLVL